MRFSYNDLDFSLIPQGTAWELQRDGVTVGAGLFACASPEEALRRGQVLAKTLYPVGVRLVGPDVAHPTLIGDLKIVGPDVGHPNFIHWEGDSVSPAKNQQA